MTHEVELTVNQVANELGVSPRTVRRWLAAGRIVGRKVDRRNGRGNLGFEWRVSADEVRRMAADVSADVPRRTLSADAPSDSATADGEALLDEVRSLREENVEYRIQLERLTEAVGRMAHEVLHLREEVRKALPAPAAAIAVPNDSGAAGTVPNDGPEPPRRRRWWPWG